MEIKELYSSLDLLLGSDIGVVTALLFPAIGGLHGESGVAFTANHSIAFVFPSEVGKIWLNGDGAHAAASESEHEVES